VKIPREVREFVARFLPSIEHLETFMLLRRDTTRSWSAADIAAQLGIGEAATLRILEQLAAGNFLDIKISNDVLFRFNPLDEAIAALSAQCADLYVRERIAMINLVAAVGLGGIHDFAEAFRLKKPKKQGHDG